MSEAVHARFCGHCGEGLNMREATCWNCHRPSTSTVSKTGENPKPAPQKAKGKQADLSNGALPKTGERSKSAPHRALEKEQQAIKRMLSEQADSLEST